MAIPCIYLVPETSPNGLGRRILCGPVLGLPAQIIGGSNVLRSCFAVAHYRCHYPKSFPSRRGFSQDKFALCRQTESCIEHGTIRLMLNAYGKKNGNGGKAERDGFKVSGARCEADIQRAFYKSISSSPEERRDLAVSNYCGSILLTTEALGIVLVCPRLF